MTEMTRLRAPLVAALALILLPAAAAKGLRSELSVRPAGARGPLVQYDLAHAAKRFALPAGMLSADGTRFVFVRGRKLTFYSVVGRRAYLDAQVAAGSSVEAVSPEARLVVLRSGAQARLVDGVHGKTVTTLTLPSGFTVDALAPDGHWLYLIQHKGGQAYAVRRYNLRTGVLATDPLVQKGEQEQMAGTAAGAIQSRDGEWQFTLYVNRAERMAFVHALNLEYSYTVCIDLPGHGTPAELRTYALAASPDGKHVYAANPALGLVQDFALDGFRALSKRFAAAAGARSASAAVAPSGRTLAFSGGSRVWLYDTVTGTARGPYSAGGNVVGLGFADARRLFAARSNGRLTAVDATTGKRD
ncbi:MAG: hypothetical protein QOF50_1506 [Gaiellaceae bacterium]|jgi:hypothetical protein|nr:hypothetical protein [Gaiellaceae bacterium]